MRIVLAAAVIIFSTVLLHASGERSFDFDTIIKNGAIYDGSGGAPFNADVGIKADRIAAVGDLSGKSAGNVIEAKGLAVSPGFINMLSWSSVSLIIDGRSQSEIRQGVTTEIFGEGQSMGPLTEEMKRRTVSAQGDLKFDVAWTGLCEYLTYLEKRGISPNVGSFVGAGTVRENVIGLENKKATPAQMERMCDLVRLEMEAGALGVGSSLGYAPDMFASTDELIAMCRVAAKYGGMYISHVRNEGGGLIEAVDELLRISREAGIASEIYHLKAGGENNWDKIDSVISMIERARRDGLRITADIYLYTASSNRLSSRLPAWAREGGDEALLSRLRDPAMRRKIGSEMRQRGMMPKTLLIGFTAENLRPLTGKTLEEAARIRGKDQVETMLELIAEDNAAPRVATFVMSEENIKKELRQPWVSLWIGCCFDLCRGRVFKTVYAPARLRKLQQAARKICARRKGNYSSGSNPPPDRPSCRQPGPGPPGADQGGVFCRPGSVRSRNDSRPRNI